MSTIFTLMFATFAALYFTHARLLTFLRYFQQEQYNHRRFLKWIRTNLAFDRFASPCALTLAVLLWGRTTFDAPWLVNGGVILLAAILGIRAATEKDPRTTGKIKLNMTERATRIYTVSMLIASATLLLLYVSGVGRPVIYIAAIGLFIQAIPLAIVAAHLLLLPDEDRRQKRFMEEAKARLASVAPRVIGITGSFGKTSTKNILGELVNVTLGPAFWPSKGVNSPMGITRELRERLHPAHDYAVVEMGAFQIGSIRKLCNLVPPSAGIVTAVGLMHLERMGSPENIYKAKSELPAAIPEDGILVLNGDNEGTRRMATDFRKKTTLLYGLDPELGHLDCWATDIETTPKGMRFTLHWEGKSYPARLALFGKTAVSNALGAFAMVCALGARPETAVAALANVQPVDNRLQVEKSGETLRVKDAYNSNPAGFSAALDVLKDLPGNRRILITPGMIELGSKQAEENRSVAMRAAAVCDLAFIVGKTNRDALVNGLKEGGLAPEKIVTFDFMNRALARQAEIQEAGDVILIENDLPDLYETKVAI